MKRRGFLQGLAGVTVVVVGGTVWRSADQGVFSAGNGPAYEPWSDWRAASESGPLALVRAGILAANPHNTQPWIFRVDEDAVELYADRTRNLGTFDPYLREMHLGLGCAVENMMRAARANGYSAELAFSEGTLGPIDSQPEQARVARIALSEVGPTEDALHDAIPRRHTNRGPYDSQRPVSSAALSSLAAMADDDDGVGIMMFTENQAIAACWQLIVEATEAIIADEPMVTDSERWFRHSWEEVQAHRDGPTLDAAGLSPVMTAIAKVMPRSSAETNHRYWLDATRDVQVATAPAFGLIGVQDLYDRAQTLGAGRIWQRMHLWATTQGLAMQPLNQPVERVDRERELGFEPKAARALGRLVGEADWQPTFVFRVGYPSRGASPSPRRSAEQVLV
ncbi:hypothetical protein IEI94_09545 [Halomonas sp. ML-15]|uniref:Acg family FMN-binding oxidoreductase n=1 Tax=Halomonas sp. ML-15 TaxID=2773305 RepID=UPI0017467DB8|nr:hypothetical protein [Halomonas sp. ML-15]MBD3896093.1 hypothetical protein [Halomonas sp. ML-15]